MTNLSTIVTNGIDLSSLVSQELSESDKISSNTLTVLGSDQITNIISLTQAEYDAIETKKSNYSLRNC